MKKSLKIFALILALLMVVPVMVACGNKGGEGNQGGTTADPGTVDTSDGEYASKLPAYDWDEDIFYILGREDTNGGQGHNFEIWRENMPGDVVGDAVYTRNETLRKKYNFIVEAGLVTNTYTEAQTLYDAQDDVYDLVIYQPSKVFNHASSGYLLDLYSIDYLDFDHPTWSADVNRELTVGGKLFASTNQFLLQDKKRTYIMFYNREMSRQNGFGNLEDHVDNNTWTLEKMEEVTRALSFDIDGGGGGHYGDNFGLATEGPSSFWAMISGAGFTLGTNDGETITLTGATNEMNSIIDAAGKIWFDKNVTTMPEDFTPMDYYSSIRIFCEGRSLFMLSFPSDFDQTVTGGLNDSCKFEFGVMPFPKYDSEQERYYNAMNVQNASIFAIPYTVADPAQVGFYLEAISEESVDTSYPAFIESKCMIQDSYDELTARMLSLSFDSMTYDVVTLLNPGGIFGIVSDQVPTFRTNIFIRLYNSKGDKPQIALDEYVTNFEELE